MGSQIPSDAVVRRVQIAIWLAMVLSIGMYVAIVNIAQPVNPRENLLLVNVLLLMSAGLVGASFPLKKRIADGAAKGGAYPARARQAGMIVALALCEAAALFGVVVWFTTGWKYCYAFFVIGVAGQLLHYPGKQD